MSLDPLIVNLDQPEEADRIYAAQDLGDANDPAGIAPLCLRLKTEPSRAVKEAIMTALGRIRQPQVIPVLAALLPTDDTFVCNQAVLLLAGWGPSVFPQVETILRCGDAHTRKLALDVLGRVQAPGVEPLYRVALQDPDPNLVITAVEYIGTNTLKPLRKEVEQIFQQAQEPMLLTAALETLCAVGDAASLEQILARFPEEGAVAEMLQYPLIKAVGCLGDTRSVPRLVRLLQEGPPRLARPVVDALLGLRARCPALTGSAALLGVLLGLLERNLDDLTRYQILVLLGGAEDRNGLMERLAAESGRLKDPELVQAWRERASSGAL